MVSGVNDVGSTASADRAKVAVNSAAMAESAAADVTEVHVNGEADRQPVEQMNVSDEKPDTKAKNRVARYFQKSKYRN